mgnify:CR=1
KVLYPGEVILFLSSGFSDISPTSKVEDVIFKSPVFSCLVNKPREEFGCDNFPWVSMTLLDYVAVIIANCSFAKV